MALTLATIGLAACGDDDGDDNGASTAPGIDSDLSADLGEGRQEVVIKTRIAFRRGSAPTGEVVSGSSIGDSPFCPGGTFRDKHGNPEIGSVDRTLSCPDGDLRIGFTPGKPQGRTQDGPWKVLSATGVYDGLRGHGQMEVTYEPGTAADHETFTGAVVP